MEGKEGRGEGDGALAESVRQDKDFDAMGAEWDRSIYGNTKGFIRSEVLWEDMTAQIPGLAEGRLSVVDAGGGSGRLAARMAKAGNRVTLCDPSQEMLTIARRTAEEAGVGDEVTFVQAKIEDLAPRLGQRFDLVVCHAVLEWLAEPSEAPGQLADLMEASGRLSLSFYNFNAALLKQAVRGRPGEALRELDSVAEPRPDGAMPLREEDVRAWLSAAGLEVEHWAGVRIFHDHVQGTLTEQGLADLLALEMRCRMEEPFASLAQHLHLVCRRKAD